MKYNLGCGPTKKEGYRNVDLDQKYSPDLCMDIRELVCEDESVDEIIASHILEHVTSSEARGMLRKFYRWLIPGGILYLSMPDWSALLELVHRKSKSPALFDVMFGHYDKQSIMTHQWLMSEESLRDELGFIGFIVEGKFQGTGGSDNFTVDNIPISLNLECRK